MNPKQRLTIFLSRAAVLCLAALLATPTLGAQRVYLQVDSQALRLGIGAQTWRFTRAGGG